MSVPSLPQADAARDPSKTKVTQVNVWADPETAATFRLLAKQLRIGLGALLKLLIETNQSDLRSLRIKQLKAELTALEEGRE